MNELETVWIVDDDKSIRWVMEKALQKAAMITRSFVNAQELLASLEHDEMPDVLITDIRMSNMNGLELLEKIQLMYPQLLVIVMTAYSDLDSAVAAFHGGAFDYLPKPFDIQEVVDLAHRACVHSKQ